MTDQWLKQVKEKTEAMLHWKTKGHEDLEMSPYPDMKKLCELVEIYEEVLTKYANTSIQYFSIGVGIEVGRAAQGALIQGEKIKRGVE